VRLKGGDPFVFGRGGEEAIALADAGVAFEVVPGVSSLAAVPASVGIPVTHRGVAAQVTLVSGHSAGGDELDFAHLARTPGTLVFFMGLRRTAAIADGLIANGMPPTTPAAVVARGTRPDARAAVGELQDLPRLACGLPQPALIVVGDVVALGERIVLPADALHAA
jgi:siroheme synthase